MQEHAARHSDQELYTRLGAGDAAARQAFAELYARHAPRVYSYCRRILDDTVMAEDIFQETFARFYQSAQGERTMTNVAGYLLRIARNLCLNARADKHYGMRSLENLELSVQDRGYENAELQQLVQMALEYLPVDYREAFVLREYNDLSYREIAVALDISVATVRIRIYRARKELRRILAPWFEDTAS